MRGNVKELLFKRYLNEKLDPNPHVTEIDLSNTKDDSHTHVGIVDEKGLMGAIKQSFPKVTGLNLSGNYGFTLAGSPERNPDEFSVELRDLPEGLTELNLSKNDLRGVRLDQAPTSLKVLDISDSKATNRFVRDLTRLNQLETLKFRGTFIDWKSLWHYPTSLKTIYCLTTNLMTKTLRILRRVFPVSSS